MRCNIRVFSGKRLAQASALGLAMTASLAVGLWSSPRFKNQMKSDVFHVPGVQYLYSGHTYEKDGYIAHFRGIFNEAGRLVVMINFNSDLGDAWEWADSPYYAERYTSTAYRLGINYIVYTMTH